MISHKYQCIFVHIPKTGGTSLEDLIWPDYASRTTDDLWMGFVDRYHNKYQTGGMQHLLANQIKIEVGIEVFEKYFKFSIVRNPWDKAVSQYEYIKNRKDLMDYIGMKQSDCFKQYLNLIATKKHVQWEPQINFICDINGDLIVDYVGRFEFFEKSANHIKKILSMEYKNTPHLNKGTRTSYQSYYDFESMEFVQSMYKDDIAAFNYYY